jgi:hypothetical protein
MQIEFCYEVFMHVLKNRSFMNVLLSSKVIKDVFKEHPVSKHNFFCNEKAFS